MTSVTIQFRENRLAKLVLAPGGKRQDEAVAEAASNLSEIQSACLEDVDGSFDRLKAAAADPALLKSVKAQRRLYGQANRIAGVAGSCGLAELGEAAFSLCELVDRQIIGGSWNAQAVAVHIDAMTLLRGRETQLPLEGRKAILLGLKDVAARARLQPGDKTHP